MAGFVAAREPFLEREGELARIERLLAEARDGHGAAIAIEGPAGIGKTSLLSATRSLAEEAGMRVLRARGAQLEQDFAFGVVRQLFEPPLIRATAEERRALLHGAAALGGGLLGLGKTDASGDGLPAGSDSSVTTLHGLYWLCANLAAERPLCLVVDDAHWADPPSLRYLAFLLPRLEELCVALVFGARPGDDTRAVELVSTLIADAAVALLRPAPLSLSGVGRLIAEGLGTDPQSGFVEACGRATGGNPFLVGELVAALAEDSIVPDAAATVRIETLGARWAARWIQLRLDRLPRSAARIARALAILERADLSLTAQLAGLESETAGGAVDALVAAAILTRDRPLAFVHPIVRAGIYGDIGLAERARAHRTAAGLLADSDATEELVAEHLLASEPAGDGWVVERLVSAARAAMRSGAPDLAAVYLRRALAEPPSRDARSALLLELGVAEVNAGDDEALAHMEAAVVAAEDAKARVSGALVLAHALARDNRFSEAIEVIDRATESIDADDQMPNRAAEALAATIAAFSPATAQLHARRIRAARDVVETDASASHEQLALASQLAVRSNESADVAAELALRALGAARRALPAPTDLPWFHQCAVTLLWTERYEELRALLDRALTSSRSRGDASVFSGALAYRGWLALRRGDLRAAEVDARTALDAPRLPAPAMYRLRGAAVLVDALTEQGQLEEAARVLGPIDDQVQADSTIAANLRLSRGRLRVARRTVREALADFLGAGEVATATGLLCPSCLPWRSEAALAHLALGQSEAARRLAEEELELARACGAPRALGVALLAEGLVVGPAAAEETLREAVAAFEQADAGLELARARTELGAFLRRAKRRVEARALLTPALGAARRAGARPLAERAETELRATGARPRRTLLTGLEALTASERRVAELAADGLTNREIAQTLFVTTRTVDGHLTHVFRKLDISSREQLAPALTQE